MKFDRLIARRMEFGASLMLTGLLAMLCGWRLFRSQRRISDDVGQDRQERLVSDHPSAAESG